MQRPTPKELVIWRISNSDIALIASTAKAEQWVMTEGVYFGMLLPPDLAIYRDHYILFITAAFVPEEVIAYLNSYNTIKAQLEEVDESFLDTVASSLPGDPV